MHNTFLDLYKLPCLWDDRFIPILSWNLCCKSTRVTLNALFPHSFGSTFGDIALNESLFRILGCFIVLLVNASRSSNTIIDGILYFTCHFYVLGILDTM